MKTSLLLILPMAVTLTVHAQQTAPAETPGTEGSPVPPTLAAQQAQKQPRSEQNGQNYLTGGLAISQVFTDNAEMAPGGTINDLSYNIEPYVAFNHSTTRLSYNAGIFAGFTANRTLSERNMAAQTGSLDVSARLTQFTTLRLSDSFSNTTGLWSGAGVGGDFESTGIGVLQQPNRSSFTFGRYRTNDVLGELSHQFTLNGVGGVRGTQSFMWFPESATSPVLGTLYGSQTYTAEAFYNYRFNRRHWVGVTLRGQRFDLARSVGRTDTLSSIFSYGLGIQPSMSLSLFAGPQFSVTALPQGLPVPDSAFSRRGWSPLTGAVFSWEHQRTGATASFVRGVSDGAGLASAVTLSTAEATLTRQLSRLWQAGVSFEYTRNEPIVPSQAIRTYSGSLQVASQLTRNIALTGGYGRDSNRAVGTGVNASADRIWVSVSFSFLRPLGR